MERARGPRSWSRWAAIGLALTLLAAGLAWGASLALPRLWTRDAIETARAAYDRGDWQAAAESARARLREQPDDEAAIRLLARASARSGRDDLAMSLYGRLGEDRLGAEDLALLAVRLSQMGQTRTAQALLGRALTLEPDQPDALAERVRLLAAADSLAEAARLAERLTRVPGWEARGRVILGMIQAQQGDPAAAARTLAHAPAVEPGLESLPQGRPAVLRLLTSMLLAGTDDVAEAERIARELLAEDPGDAETRRLLSRVLLRQKRYDEAAKELARAGGSEASTPAAHEPSPFVGSAACASCHPEIHAAQTTSRHARTFLDFDEIPRLDPPDGPLPDPANAAVLHAIRPNAQRGHDYEVSVDGQTLQAWIRFAFGSGDRGATLVGVEPDGNDGSPRFRELRLSHYADGSLWDVTTGHPRELPPGDPHAYLGMELDEDSLRRCLECHTTQPLNWLTDPEANRKLGHRSIGCETCHGPGGHHLLAMNAAPAFPDPAIGRPRLADQSGSMGVCARCHSPKGMDVRPEDPTSIRFQSDTLTWSRCYTESRGALSCTSCHDPHRNAETSHSYYEKKCLACHDHDDPEGALSRSIDDLDGARPLKLSTSMNRLPCPVSPRGGCVDCHMPTKTDVLPHTSFTDHFIRVQPAGD